MLKHVQRLIQITAPDVAAVDQAERKNLVSRQAVQDHRVLVWRAYQIDMQTIDRQRGGETQIVFQATEVGRNQLLQRRTLQQVVGTFERVFPILRQIQHENRFIDLHPFDALRCQSLKHLAVYRQQPFEQFQLVEPITLGLALPQISQRADQHRLDRMSQRLRFCDFLKQLRPGQLELLIDGEFRDQVVVVGIEPLGHFLRLCTAAAALGHTTRHGEQRIQRRLAIKRAEALRDHAEHQGMRQHLVVPGEIADWQQLDTGVGLQLPVSGSQVTADLAQLSLAQVAFPIRLERFL